MANIIARMNQIIFLMLGVYDKKEHAIITDVTIRKTTMLRQPDDDFVTFGLVLLTCLFILSPFVIASLLFGEKSGFLK